MQMETGFKFARMVKLGLAAAIAGAALQTGAQAQIVERPVAGDPVAIDSGKLAGKLLDSGVKAYLGVPFAAAPVGDLRWREPQPVKAWRGVYNADRKAPECMQVLRNHNINHYFGEEATSEDCLYMNIWAPGSAKPGAKLPVVVFIYGGGNTIGSSGMSNYGGEQMARRGAVFVNFNYRVGLLGFMAHPELTAESPHHASGDYAYLDQVAALQWIRRNIDRFGGDPGKVVITGQSAGAGSVSLLQASPLAKGLFRGVVAMSGGAWGNGGQTPPRETAEKVGLQVQDALKGKSIADLRQMSADKIVALQADCQLGCSTGAIRTGGAVVDGYFLPQSVAQIFAAHQQSDVPVILGMTHDESTNDLRSAKSLVDYQSAARRLYGDKADQFLKLYPASTDAEAKVMGSAAAREGGIEKGLRAWAMAQARWGGAPVRVYMFSRVHPYTPGVVLADQDTKTIGAYHTADVPYWFDTFDAYNRFRPTRTWTAYDQSLTDRMGPAMIAFARTSDPNTAAVSWPAWTPGKEQLIEFGDDIRVLPMDTPRLNFQQAVVAAPSTQTAPRAARD